MKKLLFSMLLALALWTIMFSPWTAPYLNFWVAMSFSALLLTGLTFAIDGPWWKQLSAAEAQSTRWWLENIVLAVLIAAVLWLVFWLGDKLSQVVFPTFARHQVDGIYSMKEGENAVLLSLLLVLIIGPAEEIFWRGYVQRRMSEYLHEIRLRDLRIGASCLAFVVVTLVYALVHLFSFNFMLIIAALVCGVAWGGLFWLFPNRFPAILLSHALWDAAVFIWFPIL